MAMFPFCSAINLRGKQRALLKAPGAKYGRQLARGDFVMG
jgi:hypothetical protein